MFALRFRALDPSLRRKEKLLLEREFETESAAKEELGRMLLNWDLPLDVRVTLVEKDVPIEKLLE